MLAGSPPKEDGGEEIDPLAIYYRETATMMEPAVRIAQNFPEAPSVQLRLCDGLDGILSTVRQRLTTLSNARELRRQDSILVDTLCNLLVQLDAGQAIDPESLGELAEQILAEAGKTRLRFIYTSPAAVQEYLGGSSFPPPARFIAGQSISAGRVMARIVRHAPEWRPIRTAP